VIVGDVYNSYGAYTNQDNYNAAIDATNTIIQNCYIANCSTPVRGNGVTITNTTLYGGTVANLILSGSVNTLTDVTTVNYNDIERDVVGLGIVINEDAAETTKLVLNGKLKQYNYVCDADISDVPGDDGKLVFNQIFGGDFSDYYIGENPRYVNAGIISMSNDFNSDDIEDNANTGYVSKDDVAFLTKNGAVYSTPASGTVDNSYNAENDSHKATVQGDYLPTPGFALGEQMLSKDNDDDTNYLIGDINGLEAMYEKGETPITIDLTALMKVYKYEGVYYPVSAQCKDSNGNVVTATDGKVTLTEKGTYTLVFTVDDNVFYGADGKVITKSVLRTYEVQLVLDVYEKSIADATITVSDSALEGEYITSGTSKKYKMYPLDAITSVMDDANKDGTLETFNCKANIQSALLTPENNNAFSSASTITITYTGGQVLTFVLGTPSELNSPGASAGGKTFSVYTDNTNGIYLKSDGAVASGSAVTGTWPITSWSFKGTSGKVITDNTKVTINFTKPSSGNTNPCVTPDTLITLADGSQKRIDEVTYADQLLVWNAFEGRYDAMPSAIIFDHGYDNNTVIELNFSDGTAVKAVNLHQFFDADLNRFVTIDAESVAQYVGHRFVKQNDDGYTTVTLVDYDVREEYVEAFGIISARHYNILVEGMLSTDFMPQDYDLFNYFVFGEDMKFDAAKMQEDIDTYGLYTYEDFADYLTREQFDAFNVQYFKIPVGKGFYTYEGILALIEEYLNT